MVPEAKEFSVNDFRDTLLMCTSRSHALDVNKGTNICMVPYADMFNHSPKPALDYMYNNEREAFVMKAFKDIPKDTELSICYALYRTTSQFFLDWGFVIHPYKNDSVTIELSLKDDDPNL